MFTLEHVPNDVARIAHKWASVTKELESKFQSITVTEIAALIPGGGQLQADCIAACELAVKACNTLEAIADSAGVTGRLRQLGIDLTALEHEKKHGISFYVHAFEIVFHDLFGQH